MSTVGCGQRLPEVHLIELTDVVRNRYRLGRTLITACGTTDVPESARPDPDSEDCAGCADCLRYCRKCVAAAVDWLARTDRRG